MPGISYLHVDKPGTRNKELGKLMGRLMRQHPTLSQSQIELKNAERIDTIGPPPVFMLHVDIILVVPGSP